MILDHRELFGCSAIIVRKRVVRPALRCCMRPAYHSIDPQHLRDQLLNEMTDLKLIAFDEEDLKVVSAHLQDAVVRVGDMAYLPKERRFAALLNRFDWELAAGAGDGGKRRRKMLPSAALSVALRAGAGGPRAGLGSEGGIGGRFAAGNPVRADHRAGWGYYLDFCRWARNTARRGMHRGRVEGPWSGVAYTVDGLTMAMTRRGRSERPTPVPFARQTMFGAALFGARI